MPLLIMLKEIIKKQEGWFDTLALQALTMCA